MNNLLLSKFETYLLDEELDLDIYHVIEETIDEEPMFQEEYPPGFFSSL